MIRAACARCDAPGTSLILSGTENRYVMRPACRAHRGLIARDAHRAGSAPFSLAADVCRIVAVIVAPDGGVTVTVRARVLHPIRSDWQPVYSWRIPPGDPVPGQITAWLAARETVSA